MKLHLKHKLLLLAIIGSASLFSNRSFGQIDTVTVGVQFSTVADPENSDSTLNVMNVNIEVTDIDFMGNVVVTVYESESNFPLARYKKTKAELDAGNEITGDAFSIEIYGFDPGKSYRIETLVRNYQGGNYPLISTNYNAQ